MAAEWKKELNLTNPKVNRNEYLKRIEGLIYGADPKQGFVEANVFYHPELKFQFPIPMGWKYQNSPQAFQMAPEDGKAMMLLTLAQGTSLQEAASNVVKNYGLTVRESRETNVNGLPAIVMIADQLPQEGQQQQQQQQQQQEVVRTLSYVIQQNNNFYLLVGVTGSNSFGGYQQTFTNTMQNFRTLTDAGKLNKKPERIHVKAVAQAGTLDQVLRSFKTPAARLEELAIVNGMKLTDRVAQGTLIKIVSL